MRRERAPQARHHFTRLDQVTQLVGASEADPELGFMARLLALCSLPRTDPKQRLQYVRHNGPEAWDSLSHSLPCSAVSWRSAASWLAAACCMACSRRISVATTGAFAVRLALVRKETYRGGLSLFSFPLTHWIV